jgi:hypothetical protein
MANPFRAAFTYGIPAHRGIELPQVEESPAYPTTGSLSLQAKDRLRLFRKLFKKVLSKTTFFGHAFFLKERLLVTRSF